MNTQEHNELIGALIENSSDVISVFSKEGIRQYVSQSIYTTLGYQPDELIGKSAFENVHPEDLEKVKEAFSQIFTTPGFSGMAHCRFKHKNGTWRHLELIGTNHLHTRSIQGIVVNTRDITERREIEANMARITMAVDSSSDAIGIANEKGEAIYHNVSFRQILGYTPEQLNALGGPKAMFVDGLQAEEMHSCFQRGQSWSADAQLYDIHRNIVDFHIRTSIIFDQQGNCIGLTGITTDIRERKQAERQLQAYADQISNILHSITDAFITLDENWHYQYINPEAERLLVRKKAELIGKNIWEEFAPAVGTEFEHNFKEAMHTGQSMRFQAYYPPLDTWLDVSAYPSPRLLSVYFRDITENRLLERITLAEKQVLERSVSGTFSLAQVTDFLLREMEQINPTMICSVLSVSHEGKQLFNLAAPSLPEDYNKAIDGIYIGSKIGSCGTCAYLKKPVIVTDIGSDPLWDAYKQLALAHELKACWSYPILSAGEVVATFAVYYKQVKFPSHRDALLIDRVTNLLSLLIKNKKTEESIRLTNQRYQLASRATNDAIWDWDLTNNQIYWSEGFEQLFGYDPFASSEISSWTDRIYADDKAKVEESIYRVIASNDTNKWEAEYRYWRANNTLAYVCDRGFLLRDENGQPIRMIGAMQDNTERHRSQEQLLASENMFRSIAENFPNGSVGILDTQFRFVYAAGKEYEVLQLDPALTIGTSYLAPFSQPVAQYAQNQLEKVLDGQEVVFDITFGNSDYLVSGVPIVNRQGEVDKILLATQNISVRKREEDHLRLLESVITHTKDSIIITEASLLDERGPRIVYVNQAFTQLCGYSAQEVMGLSPRILQGPKTDRLELDKIKRALLEGQPVDAELINYNKYGKEYWVSLTIVPVKDAHGVPTHFISVERDISQTKQFQQEQKALIDELLLHNRDLQQFSYITSHNLRAPVANLVGLMSLYNKQHPADPDNEELIREVQGSITQLSTTLADLVNILVIKSTVNVDKEILDLNHIYLRVMKSIAVLSKEANAQIEVDFSEVSMVLYNRVHLTSIFQNFITNAIRYRSSLRPLMMRITSRVVDQYVQLSFRDNGLGIDLARYGDRLFGLYQRFHHHPESKGLGLYIVKSQVTALGGRVEVESKVEEGTTFNVFI